MNSLKSLFTVAILGAVGVGLYMKINSMPDPKPPKDFDSSWVEPPSIDMSGSFGEMPGVSPATTTAPGGGAAPPFGATPPGGTAPVYVPPTGSGSPPPIASPDRDTVPASASVELPPSAGFGSSPPTSDPFTTTISGGPPAGGDRYAERSDSPLAPTSAPPAQHPYPEHVTATGNETHLGVAPQTSTGVSTSLFYRTEHSTFDEAWTEARALLSQKNLASAHLLLSAWHNHPTLRPAEQEALYDLLSGLAGTVIYSQEHHLEAPYTPAAGETLEQIARRYQVSPELLAKINGLPLDRPLTPGQPLKVLRGPFGAQIDTARQELVLVLGGRYAGRFEVGLGRERTDIAGHYEVRRKVAHPPYFGPDRTIEPGDPANPLGSHFLSLIKPLDNEVAAPFGIHGTNLQGSLQGDEARGYVRLSQRDIVDCYDILSEKSPVLIQR